MAAPLLLIASAALLWLGHEDGADEATYLVLIGNVGLFLAGVMLLRLVIAEAPRFPELSQAYFAAGKEPIVKALQGYFTTLAREGRLAAGVDPELAAAQFMGAIKEPLFWPRVLGVPVAFDADATVERAIAATLASEAQPFGNVRIQNYLKKERGFDEAAMTDWMNRWPGGAMAAVEKMLARTAGDYCVGDVPGLADCFLVPQMYAALRFGVDVSGLKKMNEIYERCSKHPAFIKAHPDEQPDAVKG